MKKTIFIFIIFLAGITLFTFNYAFSQDKFGADSGTREWVYNSSSKLVRSLTNTQGTLITNTGATATTSPVALEVIGPSLFDNATSTSFAITGISGSAQCLHVDANGTITGTGSDCVGSGGSGTSGAWQTFAPNVLTPTSTAAGILVNSASSTITTLVVPDSLSGLGFTNAWNTLYNATSTYPGFASQFAQYYNATTTLNGFTPANYLLTTDFGTNFASSYNATTTLNGFTNNQSNWNTAFGWGNHALGGYASSTGMYVKYQSLDDLKGAVSNDFHNLGGTDADSGAGAPGAWQAFGGTNVLTPTSTAAGILVNAASSTISTLVVPDSLSGAGFTSAFNTALNATTTLDLTTLQLGTLNVSGATNFTLPADGSFVVDGSSNPRTINLGTMRLLHTPAAGNPSSKALGMYITNNGQADTMGLSVQYLANSVVAGDVNMAIDVNVDTSDSTGGDIGGLHINKVGTGAVHVIGVDAGAGVEPLHQESGAEVDADKVWEWQAGPTWTDDTTAFGIDSTDVQFFAADNDVIYVGMATTFSTIKFVFTTVASGAGIKPTFAFSDGASGWTVFDPNDGTNGMRYNGVISWEVDNLTGWAADTVNGTGSKYWIRITRTANALATPPTEDLVQVVASTIYNWDSDGDLAIKGLTTSGNVGINNSTPSSTLEVSGTGNFWTNLRVGGAMTLGTPLTVANGGTGVSTLTGVMFGNGASAMTASTTLSVNNGGTGASTFTANGILYGGGTSPIVSTSAAASSILVTNGSNVPSLATDIPTAITIGGKYIYRADGTDVPVADGGTGASTLSAGDILLGNGTSAITATSTLSVVKGGTGAASYTVNGVLYGNGTSPLLITSAGTVGQIFQADASGVPIFASTISVTHATSTTSLVAPQGASPDVDQVGEIGIDTTSGQFQYYNGTAKRAFPPSYYPSFTYATSTWMTTGTTTIPLGVASIAETWQSYQCFTDTGTVHIQFSDGTNKMDLSNASTTVGNITITGNGAFTAKEKRYIEMGGPASSPTKLSCTIKKVYTPD